MYQLQPSWKDAVKPNDQFSYQYWWWPVCWWSLEREASGWTHPAMRTTHIRAIAHWKTTARLTEQSRASSLCLIQRVNGHKGSRHESRHANTSPEWLCKRMKWTQRHETPPLLLLLSVSRSCLFGLTDWFFQCKSILSEFNFAFHKISQVNLVNW